MSMLWEKLLRPIMFRLDAEVAHDLGMNVLTSGIAGPLGPSRASKQALVSAFGVINRFGLTFENPVGIAAGFDKNGIAIKQLFDIGFGFVEIGTVTFEPQFGNPKPRLFRLQEQKALINRLGFNNEGAAAVAERLKSLVRAECVLGINIGRNKNVSNENAIDNYLRSFKILSPFADYIAINVSSPNTPGLRDLQHSENLTALLAAIKDRNQERKPVLLKIAPDLATAEIDEIVGICMMNDIAGIIATNTTTSREGIPAAEIAKIGGGGLSGRPLEARSTEVISQIYRHSQGMLPIIGVGGIFDAGDAFRKIAAGASLVQAYTGFVYGGPGFANEINEGLAAILRARGFRSLDEAIGSAVRMP